MGRSSRKNTNNHEKKQVQGKQKNQKPVNPERLAAKNCIISGNVDQSDTNPDPGSVLKKSHDPYDTIAEKRKRKSMEEASKNVNEMDETTEANDKSLKRKKKKTGKNSPQDPIDPMDFQDNETYEQIPSNQLNSESKSSEERIKPDSDKSRKQDNSKNLHKNRDEVESSKKVADEMFSTQLNSESKSSEECKQRSKKSKKHEKTKNHDKNRDKVESSTIIVDETPRIQLNTESKSSNDGTEQNSKKSRAKGNPKNHRDGNRDEMESQGSKIVNDVSSNQLNTEPESHEESTEAHSKKSRRRRRKLKNSQNYIDGTESKENEINDAVQSTKSNKESKTSEEWNEIQSKKQKRKETSKNHHDRETEREKNKTTDRSNNQNKSSKGIDEQGSKKNRDRSHQRDKLPSDQQNSSHRENESRGKDRYASDRKNNSWRDDRIYSSHQNDHWGKRDQTYSSQRNDDSRHQSSQYSKNNGFYDGNHRNDRRSQNDNSKAPYHHQKSFQTYYDYDTKNYNAGSSNRNDHYRKENFNHQNRGKYEPHRRQDPTQFDETNYSRNTEENAYYNQRYNYQGGKHQHQENRYPNEKNYRRGSNNLNNSQMNGQIKKKSNKQPLYVAYAEYYEPTIREIEGDLFDSSEEYALGHCVAEDFSMGAGIAVEFKKRFKGVQDLLNQNKRTGEVAILQKGNRFIFYLVTKTRSNGKPTVESITKAIQSLKQNCLEFNVKKLALPRIGCGLDRLDWGEVKDILFHEFKDTGIEILVYVL